MARKSAADAGVFMSVGRALDESVNLAAALRSGTLTRAKFDAWYAKRTAEGAHLVENLQTAVSQGAHMIRAAAPRAGRRRPASRRAAAKRRRRSPA